MNVYALAGNQNSGKTTLFNALTGTRQHVGNWPGVTVERKSGALLPRWGQAAEMVDLPGVYSLSPYTLEERISRDFVMDGSVRAIVNCVDATQLERGLYLTLQLLETGRPLLVALTMVDEAEKRGDQVDVSALSRALGVSAVSVCVRQGRGMTELAAALPTAQSAAVAYSQEIERVAAQLTALVGSRWAAIQLMQGDEPPVSANVRQQAEKLLTQWEQTLGAERAALMADARYRVVDAIVRTCVHRAERHEDATERLDRVLMHPVLAYPVFLLAMLGALYLAFGPVGVAASDAFGALTRRGIALMEDALRRWQVAELARSLLTEGALGGVASVLRFLPMLLLLFLALSFLEDTGYMARAAFLMDRPLRRLGLNGRSFIPLVMGFGCTVPAAMSTRAATNVRDKRFTLLLLPFITCGAKAPICGMIATAFFPGYGALAMCLCYVLGIGMAMLAALVLGRTLFRGEAQPFLMELPKYRLPAPRNVAMTLWGKISDFLRRAFTVIFLATLAVWALRCFTLRLETAQTLEESMLGTLAGWIAPLLAPCGFGSAGAVTALLTGLLAKESVGSTLELLAGPTLQSVLPTPLSAAAFLAFAMLYPPCAA
ncbi:MAG: ferrous iron transport protein B, partial [Eubacteriales bacterium]|nr:ferrous iron transport protein B [Eubacteriales bacterium]